MLTVPYIPKGYGRGWCILSYELNDYYNKYYYYKKRDQSHDVDLLKNYEVRLYRAVINVNF